MKKLICLITLITTTQTFAVTTFQMAAKCVPVEDSAITRRIGVTSGVWTRAESECERLGKIATNQSYYYSKNKTYFPGITMDFNCHQVKSPSQWRKIGCSGGLEAGYLLEVTADIENPNKYKWYYPKNFISYYNNSRNLKECQADAQNFIWFSTDQVTAESECQIHGKEIKRAVRVKFKF